MKGCPENLASFISGGIILQVTNVGPDLVTGDTFTLFNLPVTNFTEVDLPQTNVSGTITYSWTNRLDIDGTIRVLSGATAVNTTPTNITTIRAGNTLTLSWPADHTGWRLLVQTNHLPSGISLNTNDWATVSGSDQTNQVGIIIDATKPAEFYRLAYP